MLARATLPLDDPDASHRACHDVLRRFGDRAEPALQMLAARALLQEARLLEAEGDERAGAVFEAVADRWSGESDPLVRSVVLEARANRAVLDLASLQAGDHASLQMAKRVSDRAVALLPAV